MKQESKQKRRRESRPLLGFNTALFGKFASDQLARRIVSTVILWPKNERDLGKVVKVLRWTARYSRNRRRTFTEARICPPVEALLGILLPALAGRDSNPF